MNRRVYTLRAAGTELRTYKSANDVRVLRKLDEK